MTIALALVGSGCVMEEADLEGARSALSTSDAVAAAVDGASLDADGEGAATPEGALAATGETVGAATRSAGLEIDGCVAGDTRNETLAIKLGVHDEPLSEEDRDALLGLLGALGTAAELIEIGATMLEAVGVDVPGVGVVDASTVFDAAADAARASLAASYWTSAVGAGWRVIAIARWEVCREGEWVEQHRVFDVQRPLRRWVHQLYPRDRLRWASGAFEPGNAAAALKDAVAEVATQLGWLAPTR